MKKTISIIISVIMLITMIPITAVNTFAAENGELVNFDFSNIGSSNTFTDTVSGSSMKADGWGSVSAGDNGGVYVANGYLCGRMTNIAGQSDYNISFQIQKNGTQALNAAILAMGTSNTASNINEADTCNVFDWFLDGTLYINGNKYANTSPLKHDEKAGYTIEINKGYLTITENGKPFYEVALNDSDYAAFQSVNFISMGAALLNDYGYYVGNLDCTYYYLKASSLVTSESAGFVAIDPVIYTHGVYNDVSGDLGYMMYGNKISTGAVDGEEKTTFTLPDGAAVKQVLINDNFNVAYQNISGNTYMLTGSFDYDSYKSKEGTSEYCDVSIIYEKDSQVYREIHRLNVKTNPVLTHASMHIQNYGTNWLSQVNMKRGVFFEVAALGSAGSSVIGDANATLVKWKGGGTGYQANARKPYAPFQSDYKCNDGKINNVLVNGSTSSPVDKTTGYAVLANDKNSIQDTGVYTGKANYYVDLSADSILGAHHKKGEKEYYIEMLVGNFNQDYITSSFTSDKHDTGVIQNETRDGSGTYDPSYNKLTAGSTTLTSNSWADAASGNYCINNSDKIKLTGSTDNGTISAQSWIAAINTDSSNTNTAKGTVVTNITVNVFDKTAARDKFGKYCKKTSKNAADTEKWKEYNSARLQVEKALGDYEKSTVSDDLTTALEKSYNNLSGAADYSAFEAALITAESALNNSSLYHSTADLQALYDSSKSQAYDAAGEKVITDQKTIDDMTMRLQSTYADTVADHANTIITLTAYVDDVKAGNDYSINVPYGTSVTLNSSDVLTPPEGYAPVKWQKGVKTVAQNQDSYTFVATESANYKVYFAKDVQSDSNCKITLLNRDESINSVFYAGRDESMNDILSYCADISRKIVFFTLSGWTVNGSEEYDSSIIKNSDQITLCPVYTANGNSFTVSGSSTGTQSFAFNDLATITTDAAGFICWIAKTNDTDYRVASYNKSYTFYVSGNMDFTAVTDSNYSQYADHIITSPSIDELKSRKPIPSLRGVYEDSDSINGVIWDELQNKMTIICQVADGSKYDTCGAVIMRGGSTKVTHSAKQTDAGQYLISYTFGKLTSDKTYTIKSFATSGDKKYYSDEIQVTLIKQTSAQINSSTSNITYDLENGTYSLDINNKNVLKNAYAKVADYDVRQYDSHDASGAAFTDSIGSGKTLTVVSKSFGKPVVEQTFKVYDDSEFVTSRLRIYKEDGSECATNYMAPVNISSNSDICGGSYNYDRFLEVPFSNDTYATYNNKSLTGDSGLSSEVGALYKNDGGAVVIGSVTHDKWKTGIAIQSSSSSKITSLSAYSGMKAVSDTSTLCVGQEHGTVKGSSIDSSLIFIGSFDDWRDGMNKFGEANAKINPKRTAADMGVPLGWNSWGEVQTSLSYDKAAAASDYIKNNLQSTWLANDSNKAAVYIDLDSYWDNMSNDDLKRFVEHCKENGQQPGIYYSPFVTWLSEDQLAGWMLYNPLTDSWDTPMADCVLRKPSDNSYYSISNEGFALDPTHPVVRHMAVERLQKLKDMGFTYFKLDFLVHGSVEASHYDPLIQTGIEAYNYGMEYVEKTLGDNVFINLSMAPIFPYQYANGRRIACDTYYKITETQYALNAQTYGFWTDKIYTYLDPDHTLVYKSGSCTEGEGRAQVTLAAISGSNLLIGDDLTSPSSSGVSRINSLFGNQRVIDVVKIGKAFEPLLDTSYPSSANIYHMEYAGKKYIAVFNFTTTAKTYTVSVGGTYNYTELWSGNTGTVTDNLSVRVAGKDAMLYELTD